MLRIVDDLESMTDDCYSVALLLRRSIEKEMHFAKEDIERLLKLYQFDYITWDSSVYLGTVLRLGERLWGEYVGEKLRFSADFLRFGQIMLSHI